MLNFGFGEILIVLVLAIVVVGPERLPTMLRFMGRQYGKLMRASNELRRAFMLEADRTDSATRTRELKDRRERARQRIEEAKDRAITAAKAQTAEPLPAEKNPPEPSTPEKAQKTENGTIEEDP
jgi:sec-independent protein translocase protein TatB